MAYYSRKHYQLVSPAKPTAEQAAEYVRSREAGEQAHAETMARFPTLTAENVAEALAFQRQRIRELTREQS